MNKALRVLQRITPQQLRAFEAAARLSSITGAALELHVTQPTVSVQLRDLAVAVGTPLFEPVGRRVRLTQAGEALQQTAGELLACWQRFESRMAEIDGLVRGRLRIAAVTTAEYFVPELIGPFAAAHPGVEIELAIENRNSVIERLRGGVYDLAVMMLPPDDVPLACLPFRKNPLVVVAPANHHLAGRRVRLSSLGQERWLLREPGSGTRMAAEQHFTKLDFKPQVAMSLGSNEAIKHAVAAGLGISVLSALAVESNLGISQTAAALRSPALTILDVSGFPLRRFWSVVWRKDQVPSAVSKRFVEHVQQQA